MPDPNYKSDQCCFAAKSSSIRLRTHFFACLLLVLGVACQPEKQRPITTHAVSHPTLLRAGEKILSKNRRFVYVARWYAPGATTATLDTVTMTASGVPCSHTPTQMCFEWLFRPDTLWSSGFRGSVGAVENKEEFWIHPPRYGRYRILELGPFPHIKLPAVPGGTWGWAVYPQAADYADLAWANWKDTLRVKFRYTLGSTVQLATPLGNLPCHRVQGTGTSRLGTTALEAYFHPAYGFVRLNYCNIDGSRVQLEMATVDMRPESTGKILEQVFWRPSNPQPPK
ncbi:hypothetical protein ACFQ48_03750 [Hymenobacter caeli]|uniref:Uncharacterized protein n=1 Tax=Hymenobacter caeli TaxID=2735894 RepID=A0ABX2FLI0_9BACT|nr:hypothetical protein [Hymenobacter caeli]NRT17969.1 hypothetical protein [Hymenobacter caeli]